MHNLYTFKNKCEQILMSSNKKLHTLPIPPAQSFLACQKGSIYISSSKLSLLPAAPGRGSKFSFWINGSDKETNTILSLYNPVSQGWSLQWETFADIFVAKVCSTTK